MSEVPNKKLLADLKRQVRDVDLIKKGFVQGQSKVLFRISYKLNQKSNYKIGQEVLLLGYKGVVTLVLGKPKGGTMNYLIELDDNQKIGCWSPDERDRRVYGMRPDKRYRIGFEKIMSKP